MAHTTLLLGISLCLIAGAQAKYPSCPAGSSIQVTALSNMRLDSNTQSVGVNYLEMNNITPWQTCRQRCASSSFECNGFNFHGNELRCEIFTFKQTEASSSLQVDDTSVYYSIFCGSGASRIGMTGISLALLHFLSKLLL